MKDKKNTLRKGLILLTVVVLVIAGIGISKLRSPEDVIEQSDEETIEVEPEEEKEDVATEVHPQPINNKPFLTEKTSSEESGKAATKKEEANQKKSDDSDIEEDMTPLPKDAKVVTVDNDGMTKEERKKNTKVQKNYSEENAPEKVIKDNTPEYEAEEKQPDIPFIDSGEKASNKQNVSSSKSSGKRDPNVSLE